MFFQQDNPPATESIIVDKVLGVRIGKQPKTPKIEEQVQSIQVSEMPIPGAKLFDCSIICIAYFDIQSGVLNIILQ